MKKVELVIGERVLKNGLTVLAVQNRDVATCSVRMALRITQINEGPDEHGLANLVGECLDEGTKKRSAFELAESVENIGGGLSTRANGGAIQCPAEEAGKAVRLLRECMLEPRFPSREVRRVQQEVIADIQAELEDPRHAASRRFRELVYGAHPFARAHQGLPDEVAAFRPSDLRRFHKRWFAPQHGHVALAGPAPVDESLDMLVKACRSMRALPPDRNDPAPPQMPAGVVEEHIPMDREQVHVYLGHPGVPRNHPDYYALLVMDHVLGSGPGFTSRISKRLRDDLGLCYSVYASITSSAGREPGAFTAYIGTSTQHRRAAVDGFLAEIRKIRDSLPTKRELEDVQEYLTGSFVFQLERNSNLVRYAIRAKRFELGFDFIQRYPDIIRSITRDDVRRVAREHLDPERVIIVSAGAG